MSILNKFNNLYKRYTEKALKVKADSRFVKKQAIEKQESDFKEYEEEINNYDKALKLLKDKKYKEAIPYLEKELENKPESISIRNKLGLAYMLVGDLISASIEFKEILFNDPENIEAKINLATINIKNKKFDLAIEELNKLLKKDKDNQKIKKKLLLSYISKAEYFEEIEEFRNAIEEYKKALQIEENSQILIVIAKCFQEIQDYENAILYYEKSISKIDESNKEKKADIYDKLANIMIEQNNLEKAIDYLNYGVKNSPDNYELQYKLAKLYMDKGEIELSIKRLERVIKNNDKFIEGYLLLGELYSKLGSLDKSNSIYQRILEIDKNNIPAKTNIAIINYKKGRKDLAYEQLKDIDKNGGEENYLVQKYLGIQAIDSNNIDQAIERFMKAIDINPNDADSYINLGVCFHKMNNINRAIREYEKALSIEPNNITALKNLALIYYEDGQIHDAIDLYEKILKIEPNSSNVKKMLANSYRKIGKISSAIDMYQEHIKTNENDPVALLNLGVSYFENDKLIKAIDIFNKLMKIDKKYTNLSLCYLSRIYQKNGQINKALECIRKACLSDTSFVEGFIQYGKVSLELGRLEKAIDCFKRVLKLDPSNTQAKILLEGAKKKYKDEYGYSYDEYY
jgi:tetratricopeptide (TPR) repeat protein